MNPRYPGFNPTLIKMGKLGISFMIPTLEIQAQTQQDLPRIGEERRG
jgi:hypothetical protein